jgi:DNA polymerase elongation subunit (family B)
MTAKLIFDIETIGEDWAVLDEATQKSLSYWLKKDAYSDEAYDVALANIKDGLGFSPFTGQIVAIGVLEAETNKGAVYFQAPKSNLKDFEEEGIKYRVLTEKAMLENFWQGAVEYSDFISYNGRSFDVPFLMIRSAIHSIKPTKNLLSNRYLSSQKFNAQHIDLMDQLTFYGAVQRRPKLHVVCRAFGIKSPKADGIDGDEIKPLFASQEYEKIARYNAADLRATREIYLKWENFLNIK